MSGTIPTTTNNPGPSSTYLASDRDQDGIPDIADSESFEEVHAQALVSIAGPPSHVLVGADVPGAPGGLANFLLNEDGTLAPVPGSPDELHALLRAKHGSGQPIVLLAIETPNAGMSQGHAGLFASRFGYSSVKSQATRKPACCHQ